MSTPVLLVVMVAFSFAVARLLQRWVSRYAVLSGAEYLLVGVLVGPVVAPQLITDEIMHQIQPLVSLLLGLIGFTVGMRASRVGAGGPAVTVGALSSVGVVLCVGALFIVVGDLLGVRPGHELPHYRIALFALGPWQLGLELSDAQLWLGLAVGGSAAIASPTVIERVSAQLQVRGPSSALLSTLAETSQWVGVLALGTALALARARDPLGDAGLGLGEWALLGLLFGVLCGVLFSFFIGREQDPQRLFLATVGGVIFASGVGTALQISPLFVTLIAGVTVSLTSAHADSVRHEIDRLTHPLFVMTMLLAGAMWRPPEHPWLWLLPFVFAFTRLFGRALFLGVFGPVLIETPPRIAQGLLAQGTASIAVALDFSQRFPNFAPLVLSTVLGAALVNEIFSHRALRAVMLDMGEAAMKTETEACEQ